ncbi:MAG: YaiI/YqxD family protein [Pseudomonadota bacterium]
MSVHILVDADACPVKEEVYKTAYRLKTPVTLVANSYLRTPDHPLISMQLVSDGFDAADDWIAEKANTDSLVVTSDILLAERCLSAGAFVLAPTGKPFTSANIGGAIATRAIMADLRGGLEQTGGPPPFSQKQRSAFLNALDRELNRLIRNQGI